MERDNPKIAFALGGLAGNNAHGAGFLHGALKHDLRPAMISCTSGQIYWVYQYLQALRGDPAHLQQVFQTEIADMHRYGNINLDYSRLAVMGHPGFFQPAYAEFALDVLLNASGAAMHLCANPTQLLWAQELLRIMPGRLLTPLFPDSFFEGISTAFNAEQAIGIAFNSYCPAEGIEHVYLNDAARRQLSPEGRKYQPKQASSSRRHTIYQAITPAAVRDGLWIYEYGFDQAPHKFVDGAYYRQIMLKELTFADIIFVARPVNRAWLGEPSNGNPNSALPRSYVEIQDLKTEINFNGSYTGERAQIELINGLLEKRDAAAQPPDRTDPLCSYHHIDVVEIEIQEQRSFFDYLFESPAVFERAARELASALDMLDAVGLGAHPA